MQISDKAVVTIDYTLTNDAGEVIDSSSGSEPLAYLHGTGSIIPGLENQLAGKSAGDNLKVRVEPAEGYGEYHESMIQTIDRAMFEGVDELAVGMEFHAQAQDGSMQVVRIAAIDGDNVTIDGNHPLAGVPLNFDVTVVEVREASDEELSHGHVHGPDGHHH
ncbi:FKBP-type peptidyl-prolyl cis-trans isomerase [Acidihalobacter ferrooxydans]|uniref:Peptidyl-prolyl cis-trans isomerase n=1 Tax=Acidihalobacter ferrooxydans TaxID=1765967 RepID=A0A1P8UIQ7_9GAMM|nr:peptidylprolyl isomerase [Acidihalobacter ferrooxydans]APZ43710.1 peptidylprolyl isomerase [Acidihalobacter ferrooxydans]